MKAKILDKMGKNFVTLMLVIAICALFARFAVEKLININISQNESNAQANLKLISAAIENYAQDNHGSFPADISVLIKSSPAYLDRDYTAGSPIKGYIYQCSRIDVSGYNCSATPVKCKITGTKSFFVSTGGILVSENCNKGE